MSGVYRYPDRCQGIAGELSVRGMQVPRRYPVTGVRGELRACNHESLDSNPGHDGPPL